MPKRRTLLAVTENGIQADQASGVTPSATRKRATML